MINSNPFNPKIIACRDNKSIVKRMKKIKIWKKVKQISRPYNSWAIIYNDELYVWNGLTGDSGYCFFQCEDPILLLALAAQVATFSLTPTSKPKH